MTIRVPSRNSATGETEEHFLRRKGSFHQEDTAVLSVHAPRNMASNDMWQRLAERQTRHNQSW